LPAGYADAERQRGLGRCFRGLAPARPPVQRRARTGHQELARFRRAAEALPDGVLILDGHRAIEWMNLHAEACLGLKASVDTGSRITHLLREPEFLAYLDSPTIAASRWTCTRNAIPGARCRSRRRPLPRDAPCCWCAT
jgi:PAS domain-containing protein